MHADDIRWMKRALELAEHGRGLVEPNPLVGAVVVRNDQCVGEGWHERFGAVHAEIHALARAGQAARGATLYITLEPCCHHGKTPPCTDAILQAGVRRVVAAMLDPFPQVAGRGAGQLRQAGISVDLDVCRAEARRLNAPYLTLVGRGRPHVHAKWAMTLDGKICTRSGDSQWISGAASRRYVHELRGRMDAIVIGIGTALADDPRLTARPPGPRAPCRIVLDSRARLPMTSKLAATARETPTLVAVGAQAHPDQVQSLREQGCEVLLLSENEQVRVTDLLNELGRRRWTNVLVEGGSAVLGSFFDAGVVDEVHAFIAPKIVGGAGKSPVGGRGIEQIARAVSLHDCDVQQFEGDVLVHGLVERNEE
jgi:diaminohydroxyphosphoribosylaminopyrimidine deaminase/5-amino-6-(5-phosphoribosylamino)uracil reductase